MHEFSLLKDIFRKIEQVAAENNVRKVSAVKVRIGALAHISGEHFREHFDHAAPGTAAEGARLEVEVSSNQEDPRAQEIVLESVEVPG